MNSGKTYLYRPYRHLALVKPVIMTTLGQIRSVKTTSVSKGNISCISSYRAILVQLFHFFDQYAAKVLYKLFKSSYRLARPVNHDIQKQFRNELASPRRAQSYLKLLMKANLGDPTALEKVIALAYGQRGRLRHEYLAPFMCKSSAQEHTVPELLPGHRRTRPPQITPRMYALLQLQIARASKISPQIPVTRSGKPLDPRREANHRWSHYTKLLKKVLPPLPHEGLTQLRKLALPHSVSGSVVNSIPPWRVHTRSQMQVLASVPTTDPHVLSPRYIRRIYQRALGKSPILAQSDNGEWVAKYHVCTEDKRQEEQQSKTIEQLAYLFGT